MDNYSIADQFSILSKLMDIHGEDSFRSKSYASAAFAIEKLQVPLEGLPPEKLAGIKGIGSSSAKKITELLTTGHLAALDTLIASTPPGIIEMLRIKGLGPKKIHLIWKEMGIESLGELLYACRENRLKLYKGFGEKTQQNITESIEFYLKHQESHLYAQVMPLTRPVHDILEEKFGRERVMITGAFARQMEVIDFLEFSVAAAAEEIRDALAVETRMKLTAFSGDTVQFSFEDMIQVRLYPCGADELISQATLRACSSEFAQALEGKLTVRSRAAGITREEDLFEKAGLPFIPAPRREDPALLDRISGTLQPAPPIQMEDIKGLIHCHSRWSDGGNSLEELAEACLKKGLQYMVISDHSKSAFYAQGLTEDRVMAQQEQVDLLNDQLKPFRIFKSIECDILNDGSLDYSPAVLASFDLVIASVHSNLRMNEEKAMERLMRAIENPFTVILGHMTGRLLLSRNGYPVNHDKIIHACAENNVVIELNANPNRLDIDWRYIDRALDAGVLISINPDAHSTEGIDDMYYGLLQAQKTMLSPAGNLSSFSLPEFEKFISDRRRTKGI